MSAQPGQHGAGFGEPARGARQLLLYGAEVPVGASLRGNAEQPEAVDAGLDIPEVLTKIVNQVDEECFRRRDIG